MRQSEPHTIPDEPITTECDTCIDGGFPIELGRMCGFIYYRCRCCHDEWRVGHDNSEDE